MSVLHHLRLASRTSRAPAAPPASPRRAATVTAYGQGFIDGVAETLDQLEGRSTIAPAGRYHGPVPGDLRAWIAGVRRELDLERSGTSASGSSAGGSSS